jgi:hypothetical protein
MPSQEVDVTGLMAQATPGWEQRAKDLAKPEYFVVDINPTLELARALGVEEYHRLRKKLEMVKMAAKIMAAGMVKGTVKYATDGYDLKQWVAHLLGEGADQMNYQLLLAHAFWAEQAEAKGGN